MNTLERVRAKHPAIEYRGYSTRVTAAELHIGYDFLLYPDIDFHPQVVLPLPKDIESNQNVLASLEPYIYQLGLVELLSYWKAACPPKVILHCEQLSEDQLKFWQLLFREGLSEFYYVNGIDPDSAVVPTFEFSDVRHVAIRNESIQEKNLTVYSGSLLLVSGGKDTACLLNLYSQKETNDDVTLFHLKADAASRRLAALFKFPEPLLAIRTIDPKLIELNRQGYLNGHTPFSAYLAFLGVLIAQLFGKQDVVVANEASANEESFMFNGLPINHQFSKSFIFERAFRRYAAEFTNVNYFSAMRALDEEQICAWFSELTDAHTIFRSCNRAAKNDVWCGECPKCAFVALMLGSFLGVAGLQKIFGFNPFEKNECVANCLLLLQHGGKKPLDCVGTYGECQNALGRFKAKFSEELPEALSSLPTAPHYQSIQSQHFIPPLVLETIQKLVPNAV